MAFEDHNKHHLHITVASQIEPTIFVPALSNHGHKVVYPMTFEIFDEIAIHLRWLVDQIYNQRRLHSDLGDMSLDLFEEFRTKSRAKTAA